MPAGRTYSAVALVVSASGLMLTCVFGFLSFVPGIDPSMKEFFQLAFFVGGVVTLGGVAAYFALSRKAASGEPMSRFDRAMEQKKAALGTLPIGLLAVLIGALWYVVSGLGSQVVEVDVPNSEKFSEFDTPGIIAFLGFGTMYVAVATWMAIRAERTALRAARNGLVGADEGVSR